MRGIERACAIAMQWGRDDCGLWVADILQDALGYDPGEPWRGRYSTQRGCHRVTGKRGVAGVVATMARRRGWERINATDARVGDVGVCRINGINSIVICRAPGRWVGRNENGVTVIDNHFVKLCFNVVGDNYRSNLAAPRILLRPDFAPMTAAPREPISAAIGLTALLSSTGLFAAGGFLATAGVTAASVGGAIVATGISIGLSYAASALTPRGNQPLSAPAGDPNDASIRYNTRQAIPPKRIIYGTAQVGGALFFEATQNPSLYQGIMLCDDEVNAIKKIWIGTNELVLPPISYNAPFAPLAVDGQPDYAGNMQICLRRGTADQSIDSILAGGFPNLSGAQIAQAEGTPIGNMTNGGGLAASFDSNEAQTASLSTRSGGQTILAGSGVQSATGYVGKDFSGNPQTVSAVTVTPATDQQGLQGGSFASFKSYQVSLYANQSAPANATDGTLLGTTGTVTMPAPGTPVTAPVVVNSNDLTTAWNYIWARILVSCNNPFVTDGSFYPVCCELKFFTVPDVPASFRQRGIATAVFKYNFGANQDEYTALWGQTQRPNPILLVEGVSVPDPRKSGHILDFNPDDPAEVQAAKDSWEYSNNASLCITHYLIQRYGGKIRPDHIDWDKVAEAADWDDSTLGTVEGDLLKRGTIDGVVTLNQRPSDVISAMLSANRAFINESTGRVWVSSSKPKTALATIHDAIMTGKIEYRAAKPKKDVLNKIKVRFVAPDRDYQSVDGPVLQRDDLLADDGELLEAVIDCPYTLDNRRAQFLQKAFLSTSRLGKRINVSVDVQFLGDLTDQLIGSAINFSSDLFPQFNGLYFVETWGFEETFGSINVSLSEYDPSIETDWDAATDQQPFQIVDVET